MNGWRVEGKTQTFEIGVYIAWIVCYNIPIGKNILFYNTYKSKKQAKIYIKDEIDNLNSFNYHQKMYEVKKSGIKEFKMKV